MPLSKNPPDTREIVIGKPKLGTDGHGPVNKPPAGGNGDGGGDDWSNQPPGSRGPRESLGTYRLFLFLLLIGDVGFFVVLALVYFLRKGAEHYDQHLHTIVSDWTPIHVPQILWVNTLVLLLSSLSVEVARRRLFREPYITEEWLGMRGAGRKRTMLWLSATMVLGIAFLVGQYMAWLQLLAQRVFLRSGPASQFFYLVTAAHGLHLILGLLMLLVAGAVVLAKSRLQRRQIAVDISAWFWHAMGALWIFLFVLLEFCQ
jgi:cytochrome c oxidase subunit 3